MFLSKYNKGDFIFALTFRQWLNSFCSSHTLTHGNAGLMGLEGRNNPRSIFRKWWNEKCVRSSQLPVSRAALAQSLWCCSELLVIESLPWNLQSVMWKPLQLQQNIEPGRENLYKIFGCVSMLFTSLFTPSGVYDPQQNRELVPKYVCRCRGFLFKGTSWLLKNKIISKDKVIRQWQFMEYNQSITEYISKTDRGVKLIHYKWLYTDL